MKYVDPSGMITLTQARREMSAGVGGIGAAVAYKAMETLCNLCVSALELGEYAPLIADSYVNSDSRSLDISEEIEKNIQENRIILYHYGYKKWLSSYLVGMRPAFYTTTPFYTPNQAVDKLALPLEEKGFLPPDFLIGVSIPIDYYNELKISGLMEGPRPADPQDWPGQPHLNGGGIEIFINTFLIQGGRGVKICPLGPVIGR